jgi:ankyrin repeat protein
MGRTPFYAVSFSGHLDVVKLLFERGADIEATHKDGMTPVNLASKIGHVKVVDFSLKMAQTSRLSIIMG